MLPFKLGELFRWYSLSKKINNYKIGLLSIITERFFDSVALVLFLIPFQIISNGGTSFITIILLVFIILCVIFYNIFPTIYTYINNHLFFNRLSKRSTKMLEFLESINNLYLIEKKLIYKRSITLIVISILSRFLDFAVMYVISVAFGLVSSQNIMVEFINSAITFDNTQNIIYYVMLALMCFIVFYFIKFLKRKVNMVRSKNYEI